MLVRTAGSRTSFGETQPRVASFRRSVWPRIVKFEFKMVWRRCRMSAQFERQMTTTEKNAVPGQINRDFLTARERIPVRVFPHSTQASKAVAEQIASLIRQRAGEGRNCVLGLATGNTPVGIYNELVRMHRED